MKNTNMNSTFIYQNTQLPGFLQFPEFLLQLPISQTAKLVYIVLYDRARLSMRNEWTDEYGRVYVVYPVVDLAARIGKSESTVKTGMKELCEEGLLMKRPGGFAKPNYLYVKYALEGQLSDRVGNTPVTSTNSKTTGSQVSKPQTDRKPAASKVCNTSKRNNNNGVSTSGSLIGLRGSFPDYSCEEGKSL